MYKLENNVAWTDELKNAFKHGVTKAKIIYDKIEEISDKGDNITLNNTAEMQFVKAPIPRGNIEQNSYSGKNKLPNNATSQTISGIQYTVNDDKSISFSGTSTAISDLYIVGSASEYVDLGLSTGSYNINGCNNGSLATYMLYAVQNRNGTLSYYQSVSSTGLNISIQSGDTFRIFIRVLNGQTVNAKIYPQLEEGSTVTSYEPYCGGTASPNPDYLQEIKKVTGDVEVLVQNKNLFDKDNVINAYLNADGTTTSNNTFRVSNYIKVKGTDNIAISGNYGGSEFCCFYDKNKNFISNFGMGSLTTRTASVPSNAEYIRVTVRQDVLNEYQLQKGLIVTSYTEHEQQTYPLTLGDIELCKIGDYEDYIYKGNGKWYLHKEIKKFVYNNEGGVSSPAANYYNINSISGLDVLATLNINNCLSNKYQPVKVCQTDSVFRNETTNLSFAVGFHPNGSSIRFKDTRGLSNNEFKASLIGTIFYYALATPTDTEITDTTLINELEDILNATSYEEQTNISGSSDGISPIFDVTAYNTEEIEINYDNGIKEITLEDSVYVPELGFIGQAVAKKVTLTLLDNEQTTNLENKEFELYIGADYNNQTYYINYGNFIVNEIPENDSTNGTIRVIAYDYMIKFNKIYEDQVVYPVTLKNYLINICQQAGVELGTQSFLNDDFLVTDNQFEGKQLREILKHVGKSAFSWVRVGQDNKLYLDFTIAENIADTLTINDYKMDGYKKANEYYGPINKVTYGDSDIQGQEMSVPAVDPENVKELVINDNYFGYTLQKRNELIQAGEALFGFTYMPVSQLELTGAIYLDCTDSIEIQDENENSIITRVFSHTIKYNGAIKDTVSSEGLSNNQQTYENMNIPVSTTNRTEVSVDRANKKIQSIISEIGDRSQKTTTVTQDIDGIESKVEDIEDLTNIVTGVKTVTISDAYPGEPPLEIHIYGNNTVFDYLYPADDLFPADDLYPYGDSRIRFYNDVEDRTIELGILEVLRANSEVKDEVFINKTEVYLIRRVNADGTTKRTPETTLLGTLTFDLQEGDNTFEIVNYTAPIEIKYAIKSTYTDVFATKLEMDSSIKQSAQEIELNVSEKFDGQEIASRLNVSSTQIELDAEKISFKGDTVVIDGRGITLADGAEILGGSGVLTNLQFFGKTTHVSLTGAVGQFDSLGFECDEVRRGENMETTMLIAPDIPENFTIVSAKVILRHYPIKYYNETTTGWGYARKLKLYEVSDNGLYEDYDVFTGVILTDKGYSEITGAFGNDGFTPSQPSDIQQLLDTSVSIDISDYISNSTMLVVKSSDTIEQYTGNHNTDFTNCAKKTGMVSAALNIVGYLKK